MAKGQLQQAIECVIEEIKFLELVRLRLIAARDAKPARAPKKKLAVAEKAS